MSNNLLLVIDSFLSNQSRANACQKLLNQLKTTLPEYEILLINKSKESYGLEKQVDYYFNYGKGFLVGYPPERVLDGRYELPYVYVDTNLGVCENWLPFTGVTDHVAGMYNSFIIASNLTEMLGYNKLFRVEFDTDFNQEELLEIKNDLQKDWDYIFYGQRQEGQWAQPHHYLIDVHISAFSTDIFKGFDIVKNDKEYWELCDKIKYWGKWIEYIVPQVLEHRQQSEYFNGIHYKGWLRHKFPKTEFDTISGSGGWTDKWKSIPKICRVSYDKGQTENHDEFVLFYWNDQESDLNIESKIYDQDNIIHSTNIKLSPNQFYIEKFPLNKELKIEKINNNEHFIEIVSPDNIKQYNTRFLYEKN